MRAGVEPARESQPDDCDGLTCRPGCARRRRAGAGVSTTLSWGRLSTGRRCAPASSRRGSLNNSPGHACNLVLVCAPASSRRGSLNISGLSMTVDEVAACAPASSRRGSLNANSNVPPAKHEGARRRRAGAGVSTTSPLRRSRPARRARRRRAGAGVSTRGQDGPARERKVCAPASSRRGSLNGGRVEASRSACSVRAGVEPARESQHPPPPPRRGGRHVRAGVEPARESQPTSRPSRGPSTSVRAGVEPARESQLQCGGGDLTWLQRARRRRAGAGVSTPRHQPRRHGSSRARRRRAGAGVLNGRALVPRPHFRECAPASSRRGSLNPSG